MEEKTKIIWKSIFVILLLIPLIFVGACFGAGILNNFVSDFQYKLEVNKIDKAINKLEVNQRAAYCSNLQSDVYDKSKNYCFDLIGEGSYFEYKQKLINNTLNVLNLTEKETYCKTLKEKNYNDADTCFRLMGWFGIYDYELKNNNYQQDQFNSTLTEQINNKIAGFNETEKEAYCLDLQDWKYKDICFNIIGKGSYSSYQRQELKGQIYELEINEKVVYCSNLEDVNDKNICFNIIGDIINEKDNINNENLKLLCDYTTIESCASIQN